MNLSNQCMDVLVALAHADEHFLSRDALCEKLWPGESDRDESLTRVISELRKNLGDKSRSPKILATVPGKGYKLLVIPLFAEQQEIVDLTPPAQTSTTGKITFAVVTLLVLLALFFWYESDSGSSSGNNNELDTLVSKVVDAPLYSIIPDGSGYLYLQQKPYKSTIWMRQTHQQEKAVYETTANIAYMRVDPDSRHLLMVEAGRYCKVKILNLDDLSSRKLSKCNSAKYLFPEWKFAHVIGYVTRAEQSGYQLIEHDIDGDVHKVDFSIPQCIHVRSLRYRPGDDRPTVLCDEKRGQAIYLLGDDVTDASQVTRLYQARTITDFNWVSGERLWASHKSMWQSGLTEVDVLTHRHIHRKIGWVRHFRAAPGQSVLAIRDLKNEDIRSWSLDDEEGQWQSVESSPTRSRILTYSADGQWRFRLDNSKGKFAIIASENGKRDKVLLKSNAYITGITSSKHANWILVSARETRSVYVHKLYRFDGELTFLREFESSKNQAVFLHDDKLLIAGARGEDKWWVFSPASDEPPRSVRISCDNMAVPDEETKICENFLSKHQSQIQVRQVSAIREVMVAEKLCPKLWQSNSEYLWYIQAKDAYHAQLMQLSWADNEPARVIADIETASTCGVNQLVYGAADNSLYINIDGNTGLDLVSLGE